MKPYEHAESSARRFGGKAEDYMPIHQLMDSSKSAVSDNRHRVFTHNAWFIGPDGPLELIFGPTLENSDGLIVCVRDIGEQHILEDFRGYLPTAQDWTQAMQAQAWMQNAATPPPSMMGSFLERIRNGNSEELLHGTSNSAARRRAGVETIGGRAIEG